MHSLEIRTIRSLRGKVFANMASIESFCGHLRKSLKASDDVEDRSYTDRELAQMVQQWLSVGDTSVPMAGEATPSDISASFAVLIDACRRQFGPEFTLEEEKALTSLSDYLKRRLSMPSTVASASAASASAASAASAPAAAEPGAAGQKSFMGRFWDALNSA